MFSAGFCLFFRSLQWAEGFQGYRLNEPFDGDSFPEVLSTAGYRVQADPLFPSSLLVTNDHTDWATFDLSKDFLLVERVKREMGSGAVVYRMNVRDFQTLPNGTWIPRVMESEAYYDSSAPVDLRGKLMKRLRLSLESVEAGNVDEAVFELELPHGLHVTDLIDNRSYIVGNKFDRPSSRMRAILILANVVLVLLAVAGLVHRVRRRIP
jgi:hypothetical protein